MSETLAELDDRIARLDSLIAQRPDAERGLGMRLALGLARELATGVVPGTDTAALVAEWSARFEPATVEEAVAQARLLLRDPAGLAKAIERKLEADRNPAAVVDSLDDLSDA